MKKIFWFKFLPAKVIEQTTFLTLAEKGVYLQLLALQMQSGGFTRSQIDGILSGADPGNILKCLEKNKDGLYVIPWADDEIKRANRYSKSRSKNRKKETYDEHMNNISKTYDEHMNNISKTYDEHISNSNSNSLGDIGGKGFVRGKGEKGGATTKRNLLHLPPEKIRDLPAFGQVRHWYENEGFTFGAAEERHTESIISKIENFIDAEKRKRKIEDRTTPAEIVDFFKLLADERQKAGGNWFLKNNFSLKTMDHRFTEIVSGVKYQVKKDKTKIDLSKAVKFAQ